MHDPKFSKFDISEVTYKVVNNHEIKAFILVPKSLPDGIYPVLARFHGGSHVSSFSSCEQYQFESNTLIGNRGITLSRLVCSMAVGLCASAFGHNRNWRLSSYSRVQRLGHHRRSIGLLELDSKRLQETGHSVPSRY